MPDMKRFLFSPRLIVRFILLTVCVLQLICCTSMQCKLGTAPQLIDIDTAAAVFADTVPMQVEQTFPIPLKEYDASILPNNYLSFIAYKGQSKIYFHTRHISSFELYINEQKVPTEVLCTDTPVCIDASPYIQNGRNMLFIAGLISKPDEYRNTTEKPSVQIKIPYPIIRSDSEPFTENTYSKKVLELVDRLLTAETEAGFPGAQLVIVKNGTMLKNAAYGVVSMVGITGKTLEHSIPVTDKTLFDLASNTKMYAMNFAVQKLISEKKLFLTDSVQKFFPEFTDKKKDKIKGKALITVFDLLTHQSGFPAGRAYAKKIAKLKNAAKKSNRQHTLALIMETPLVYAPHSSVLYSDINYMLLTYIIEKITGVGLDIYVHEAFYQPLGLDRICFTPLQKGFGFDEIAATEIRAAPRGIVADSMTTQKELIHGTVHDEEAYTAMEQVSGHAGLFANAESLAVLAQVMLNNGGYGHYRFFEPAVSGYFTAQQTLVSSVGIGWRRQGMQEYHWAFSPFASEYTFGHTGWTGTLTLIDPAEQLIIILLTNAKNTPPAHHTRNSRFEGDYYLAKRYGAIITLIYEAFRNPTSEKLDRILIELAQKKYEMLLEIKAFNNNGYINDLAAIMHTIEVYAEKSPILREFLQNEIAANIVHIITENKNSVQ